MTTYRARRLPQHRGPAAWASILGDGPAFPRLQDHTTADVTIIGAGFAGLSAARRLQELDPELNIIVLDAGRIAEGAAGRNSGFMIDLPHDLASEDYAGEGDDQQLTTLNRKAQAFAASAVSEFGIDPAFFDPVGKVNGAASEAALEHNRTYAAHLESIGERYQLMDAAAMQEMTGSAHYAGGLYTPGTVMLQPAGYIRGMASGLARAGVQIFQNSPVTCFRKTGQNWHIQTEHAHVSCQKVILSVNGHLESFGFARGSLMQLFLFAMMTPDLDPAQIGGQNRWGITPSDPMGTTLRRIDGPQGGNRIVTRTCAVLRPGMKASETDMKRAKAVMQRKFDKRFPRLAGTQMAYQWAGHLCLSLNGVSVTREIESNLFSACVQNGLGTARGTLTGMAAAELALGHDSELTEWFAAEAAPKRLPPRPFSDIGANTVLRYREWRAREE